MTYDDFRNGELQGWDARADAYDTATARATVQSIPDLLAAAHLVSGMRLLDVCCGPGYAAGAAAALGAEAQGIDFAPGMMRAAQARFPELSFHEGDAERLAFAICNHRTTEEDLDLLLDEVLRIGAELATPPETPETG